MKKYAIVGIGSALLAGLLVIAGVLIGTRGLGGSAATPAAEAVPSASEVAELPIGEPGGTGRIKIPGFESMTFQAGQRKQAVELKNPEENGCYMVIVIELPDGSEIYRSGMIAPGAEISSIYLDQIPAAGSYPAAVLRYECFDLDGVTQLNGASVNFNLEVKP